MPEPQVALRADPREPDANDPLRLAVVRDRWTAQDEAYLNIARTAEEHIRCLAGRQWDVWSDLLGKFVDPLRYMSDEERRWRQRPVLDFLGFWYMVTLSKVTENQPVVGFLPANADEHSAMLAEVMDPIWKHLFDTCEMPDRIVHAMAWGLATGESYFITRPDFTIGEERELRGPAVLSLESENGPIERVIEDAPYGPDGTPLAELVPTEDGDADVLYGGDPFTQRKGGLAVEVATVLEVRSEWGNTIPWNRKRWFIHRWFLSPEEVESRYGVKVDPDTYHGGDESGTPGYLERLLFGSGYFGAARGAQGPDFGVQDAGNTTKAKDGLVCGYTMWERPCAEYPEGRLLVIGGDTVLHDGPRPFRTECAGPIRRVQMMPLPGRPVGSTPLEKMVPLQKRLNRIEAQIAEHTNLCTNPILLVNEGSGIDTEEFTARPGAIIPHRDTQGDAAKWLSPPSLSQDVWRHKADIREHLFTIGSITGNEGKAPTASPSGELIQQLRYNADRPLSPFTRSLELATTGVAEDMLAILPTIWTEEEVIHYAGEDNIVRTVTVTPELFDGSVRARPVMESAAPETREKRQERVAAMFQMGLFGDPMGEEAKQRFLELSRFPELTRAAKPGGVHRVMATRNLGALLRGAQAEMIPILPVYNLDVHLGVVSEYVAGPDYLALGPQVQEQVTLYLDILQQAQFAQMQERLAVQSAGAMLEQQAAMRAIPPEAREEMEAEPEQAKGEIPKDERTLPRAGQAA